MEIPFFIEFGIAILSVFAMIYALWGRINMKFLSDMNPEKLNSVESISLIIPARNEYAALSKSLPKFLSLKKEVDLQIVLVNDRSEDETEKLESKFPEIDFLKIKSLPEGWLGKNNALHQGARKAKGDYLLFCDADIHIQEGTLARALEFMKKQDADHLVLNANLKKNSLLYNALVSFFCFGFVMSCRPWKVSDPQSSAAIGGGIFSLIKSSVYKELGGHSLIRFYPDDDIGLGRLIKKKSYKQTFRLANDLIEVDWYPSAKEMIKGLEKNAFSGVEFQLSRAIGLSLALLFFFIAPLFLAFYFYSWSFALVYLSCCVAMMVFHHGSNIHKMHSLLHPFCALVFMGILWRSILLCYCRGGIYWRGTFYELAKLKAARNAF